MAEKKPDFKFIVIENLSIHEKARLAKEAFQNPVIAQALSDIDKELFEAFKTTNDDDTSRRDAIYAVSKGIKAFEVKLRSYINLALYETSKKKKELTKQEGEVNGHTDIGID